jgi:signal transduction histidine kinase
VQMRQRGTVSIMQRLDEKQPNLADLELLAEISQLLTLVDLDSVLQRVIGLASRAVGATRASLFLHHHHQVDWEHIFTARNLSADESVQVVTRVLDEGFAGWVYRHKRGDIILDTATDERWLIFPGDTLPVRSALCVPFVDGDHVVAVVTLSHPEPQHFTPYHLRLITIIANQATIAIRNAQLFHEVSMQRRQLQIVLQALQDVLLVLDANGNILLANAAALVLMNVTDETSLMGRALAEYIPQDALFEPIAEVISQVPTRQQWLFEARSERRQADYQVMMSLWADDERGVSGYVVVIHDITMLQDLHRFKDEMLRIASHDLRSPLALVAGYADMIAMDTPDPASPFHEYVGIIKKSVERMGNLIDDLLRVERIRTSPLELHEQTDLEALVKVVLVNMRLLAQTKNHELTAEILLDKAPRVVADPVLVRQAMENLIANAIKYTPANGKIHVRAYIEDGKFQYTVQDTGIGISKEHLPYIFEAFYRVTTGAMPEKGSGLGLSLVRNVVQRHGGEVSVKSRPNKGSKFSFWLPLTRSVKFQ